MDDFRGKRSFFQKRFLQLVIVLILLFICFNLYQLMFTELITCIDTHLSREKSVSPFTMTVLANEPVDKEAQQVDDTPYTLTIKVKLVNLFVTVVDRKGRVVKNLKKDDFFLWEDEKRQFITHFATHDDAPLSIAILLDISGSMDLMDKFEHSVQIIKKLIALSKEEDEISLFTFCDGIVQIAVPFTQNKAEILEKLESLRPYGKTALYWAVDVMPRILGKPKNRQAILLLTDGIDNLSKIPLNDVLENIKRTRLPIYTVSFSSPVISNVKAPEDYVRTTILRRIAFTTGGNYYEIANQDDLPSVLSSLTDELRYQYLLGYNSNQKPEPGSYHKLRLQTQKKKYIVRVRKGYYVSK